MHNDIKIRPMIIPYINNNNEIASNYSFQS